MNKHDLLEQSDMVITATGNKGVINEDDLFNLNKEIILVNAGGDMEWDLKRALTDTKPIIYNKDIIKFSCGKAKVTEVGSGNSINLVKEVSVSEFLDITFGFLAYILLTFEQSTLVNGKNSIEGYFDGSFDTLVKELYGEGDSGYEL